MWHPHQYIKERIEKNTCFLKYTCYLLNCRIWQTQCLGNFKQDVKKIQVGLLEIKLSFIAKREAPCVSDLDGNGSKLTQTMMTNFRQQRDRKPSQRSLKLEFDLDQIRNSFSVTVNVPSPISPRHQINDRMECQYLKQIRTVSPLSGGEQV